MKASVRKRPDTGRYEVRWREAGNRKSKSFVRKGDADTFADATNTRLQLGGIDPSAGAMTVAEFVEEYWRTYAVPNLSERTRTAYKGVWTRHLRGRIGNLRLREVTPAVVEDLRTELDQAGVGDPTIIKALGFLQGVFKRAVVRGKVIANPVREVDKPRQVGVRRAVPLAPETVEAIRAYMLAPPSKLDRRGRRVPPRPMALRQMDSMLLTLLAYVGLRPEEAINAEVEHVNGTKLYVPARKVALKDRDVSLLPTVQADLKAWCMASGVRSGLILPRPDGAAWAEDDWRNWRSRIYQRAAKAVGVTGDMRAYRLRGSYASLLLYEGRPLTYVADELGNSPAVLAKHYAGVIARLESAPRMTADDAIRDARVPPLDAERTRKQK